MCSRNFKFYNSIVVVVVAIAVVVAVIVHILLITETFLILRHTTLLCFQPVACRGLYNKRFQRLTFSWCSYPVQISGELRRDVSLSSSW